jgi:hypothetical protein
MAWTCVAVIEEPAVLTFGVSAAGEGGHKVHKRQDGPSQVLLIYNGRILWQGVHRVKHRTVDYDVQEVQPGLWRWNIYPDNRTVQGRPQFRTRELAVAACLEEINNGIERTRRAAVLR